MLHSWASAHFPGPRQPSTAEAGGSAKPRSQAARGSVTLSGVFAGSGAQRTN